MYFSASFGSTSLPEAMRRAKTGSKGGFLSSFAPTHSTARPASHLLPDRAVSRRKGAQDEKGPLQGVIRMERIPDWGEGTLVLPASPSSSRDCLDDRLRSHCRTGRRR